MIGIKEEDLPALYYLNVKMGSAEKYNDSLAPEMVSARLVGSWGGVMESQFEYDYLSQMKKKIEGLEDISEENKIYLKNINDSLQKLEKIISEIAPELLNIKRELQFKDDEAKMEL